MNLKLLKNLKLFLELLIFLAKQESKFTCFAFFVVVIVVINHLFI
jgi:hypothetical protein